MFHDDDGRKYIVQQARDHREYHHPFDGITLTGAGYQDAEVNAGNRAHHLPRHLPWRESRGRTLYKLNGSTICFAAGRHRVYHREVVARSKPSRPTASKPRPGDVFLTNVDTPDGFIQKQGHGALVSTPEGEWYYASLCARRGIARGIHLDPRGWSTPRPGNRDPESVLGTTRAGRVLKAVTAGKPSSRAERRHLHRKRQR
ncbi:hypothetical protein EJB31_05275 [Klebsiella pneumoniae]|uniref:family 43 glycosylhydrolase n=1 Tax=Klebsiella pneumoniae TaxID=573 RepID=UPI0019D6E457|nr:hypothetical protein [Klebsiella pneumoniae]